MSIGNQILKRRGSEQQEKSSKEKGGAEEAQHERKLLSQTKSSFNKNSQNSLYGTPITIHLE